MFTLHRMHMTIYSLFLKKYIFGQRMVAFAQTILMFSDHFSHEYSR